MGHTSFFSDAVFSDSFPKSIFAALSSANKPTKVSFTHLVLFMSIPKGVTTQMKVLDEYILMVLFVLLLKRVHFLVNET